MLRAHAICHNPQTPAEILLPTQPENHLVATRGAVAETSAAALDLLNLSDGGDVDGDRVELRTPNQLVQPRGTHPQRTGAEILRQGA